MSVFAWRDSPLAEKEGNKDEKCNIENIGIEWESWSFLGFLWWKRVRTYQWFEASPRYTFEKILGQEWLSSSLLKPKVQDWPEKLAACEVQINAGSSVDLYAEQLPEPWNTLQFLDENNLVFTYFPTN